MPAQGSEDREIRKISPEELSERRERKMQQAMEEDRKARDARIAEQLRAKLGRRFRSRTFDNYRPNAENTTAVNACKRFVDNVDRKDGNGLIIIGPYGVGKTHMAAAITNALLDKGIPCLFDTFSGHLATLKAEIDSGEKRRHLDLMKRVPVLVIDDVGKEQVTDYTKNVLFDVINSRYEAYLPVVITTNYNAKQLETYLGGAIFSRICETCTAIAMRGEDYRIKRR